MLQRLGRCSLTFARATNSEVGRRFEPHVLHMCKVIGVEIRNDILRLVLTWLRRI